MLDAKLRPGGNFGRGTFEYWLNQNSVLFIYFFWDLTTIPLL